LNDFRVSSSRHPDFVSCDESTIDPLMSFRPASTMLPDWRMAMTTPDVCRVVGGALVILIGTALAIGGIQLWRGASKAWPDVIAQEMTVKSTSGGMILMAALLLLAGAAAMGNLPWGCHVAAISTILLVLAAFWANDALFGGIRPLHTGTNIVVAAIILALLWFGNGGQIR
jgi:hypothetical protein